MTSTDTIPEFDPHATAQMINSAEGIQMSEVLGRITVPYSLELVTAAGPIILQKSLDPGLTFEVVDSQDPLLQARSAIVLDGASISGIPARTDVLAPNTRLAFRKKEPVEEWQIGPENGERMLTQADYDAIVANGYGSMFRKTEDGRLEMHYYDPSPKSTNFIAHARINTADEDGITTRELF